MSVSVLRLYCASSPYLHIMSQEAAVHIGPEINCDEVEVVKNEINFICCKISKRVKDEECWMLDLDSVGV